ncbi:hypothetical protein BJY01DRAFT_239237 [Aspergillus pseudoustus]|uniref:AA1-like domain-containing protein n=1 Tax=Aspergillus pseudoustus TaxID=1810923 RepID=A0ABR4J2B9_9EURO
MNLTSILATAILGASAALAAPQPQSQSQWQDTGYSIETVTVTDVTITISAENKVTSVSLKLSGDDADNLACSATNPTLSVQSAAATWCGDSRYSFNLIDSGLASFEIAVFHEYDIQGSGEYSPGQWGQGPLNLSCKSSGNDGGRVCTSSGPSSLFLTGQ